MRTQASFRAPADIADGSYRLIAGWFRATDGVRPKTKSGRDFVGLGNVAIKGRSHEMTAPRPTASADVTFGNAANLVGYDLIRDVVQAGGPLALTLHWRALAATERPLVVFVHLVDERGEVRGYGDGEPGSGAFPTTGWLAGEYLADEHTVVVAPDAPAASYRLAIGLYDPTTGQRLGTQTGADHAILGQTVNVE